MNAEHYNEPFPNPTEKERSTMYKENEMIIELTKMQMEKVSGGQGGIDCYCCSGTEDEKACGWPLRRISGKLYRCTNPLCSMCGIDQFPAGI